MLILVNNGLSAPLGPLIDRFMRLQVLPCKCSISSASLCFRERGICCSIIAQWNPREIMRIPFRGLGVVHPSG